MEEYKNYSVLMSVYKKENPEFLKRSIESMLLQTVPTDDFVIVEDGLLTDELNAVLEMYASRYPSIHLIKRDQNKGLGASLNEGMKVCRNELIARMDSDDVSLPERCEKELQAFNANSKLDIVGTAMYEFSESEDKITGVKKMPLTESEIRKHARRRNPFNHPAVMYKKSSVIAYGGYIECERGEDFELFTKMIFEGCKGINIAEPLLKYRADPEQYRRRTSLTNTKTIFRVVRNNYKNRYIKLYDVIYVFLVQSAGLVVPHKIGEFLYKKIYRSQY